MQTIGCVSSKYNGRVEHFAWNKLSGELVVHWTYKNNEKHYSVVPILASLGQTVDALPLERKTQLSFFKFNSTHEKLGKCKCAAKSRDFSTRKEAYGVSPVLKNRLNKYSNESSALRIYAHLCFFFQMHLFILRYGCGLILKKASVSI